MNTHSAHKEPEFGPNTKRNIQLGFFAVIGLAVIAILTIAVHRGDMTAVQQLLNLK